MKTTTNEADEAILTTEEENPISKTQLYDIPDDLLFLIFNKIGDLKSLCFCFSTCHRFSSVIPLVDTVILTVPPQNPNPETQFDDPNPKPPSLIPGVLLKPYQFVVGRLVPQKPMPKTVSFSYGDPFVATVASLNRFREIKFLDVVIPSTFVGEKKLFKWKPIFGLKIEVFMFVSIASMHLKDDRGRRFGKCCSSVGWGRGVEEEGKETIHLAFECLKEALVRQRMLFLFIGQNPLLERVCITDSENQGMVCLENEKLGQLRGLIGVDFASVQQQLGTIDIPWSTRTWSLPVLELPQSGYVVHGADLVLLGMNEGAATGTLDAWMRILEGLELGDDPFGETVKEILLNHGSEMKTLL